MSGIKNYYFILGVSRDADLECIKKAYRDLAKRYHPDKTEGNSESTERFKDLGEAYQVLSNEKRRAEYDRELRKGGKGGGYDLESGQGNAPRRWETESLGDLISAVDEFFGAVFGGRGRFRGREEEFDLELVLTPAEARNGGEVDVEVPPRACPRCSGRGRIHGEVCSACRGGGLAPSLAVRIPFPPGVASGTSSIFRFRQPDGRTLTVRVTHYVEPY